MAMVGSRLMRDVELLQKAKAEFMVSTDGNPYICPVLPEVSSPLGQFAKH